MWLPSEANSSDAPSRFYTLREWRAKTCTYWESVLIRLQTSDVWEQVIKELSVSLGSHDNCIFQGVASVKDVGFVSPFISQHNTTCSQIHTITKLHSYTGPTNSAKQPQPCNVTPVHQTPCPSSSTEQPMQPCNANRPPSSSSSLCNPTSATLTRKATTKANPRRGRYGAAELF